MLVTCQDYIIQALRKCGQIRPGYVSNTELLEDGRTEWQSLFDSWAAERTMGFSIPQVEFNVQAAGSQQDGNGYLIGPVYTFAATLTNGSPVISVAASVGTNSLQVGEAISGTGIPASSSISSKTASTITLNNNATASGAQTLTATPDWVSPRPDSIVRANCVMLNQGPQPVYIPLRLISAEEWASLSIRQITGINVTNLAYYDPQFPNGVLNLFPPLIGNGIELFTWGPLGVPTSLSAPYSAPPGYIDAVVWSLAERLWPMCTNQIAANRISPEYIRGKAYEACQKVRMVNRPTPKLGAGFQGGNLPSGYFDKNLTWTGNPY